MDYKEMSKYRLEIPEYFNFGDDVIDKWAKEDRKRLALVWTDEACQRTENFTFWDLKILSNKFANVLKKHSLGKGDFVLLMLPRIPEWYVAMLGTFKTGVVPIPCTTMLTPKDIEYRIDQIQAKAAITDHENVFKFEELKAKCPSLKTLIVVGGEKEGRWVSYEKEMADASGYFEPLKTKSDDSLLLFFTSGTESLPKMVLHKSSYGLAHYITAAFWQDIKPADLHWTLSDTGWAKAAWGFFGQWIIGATIFMHKTPRKFDPKLCLKILQDYGITTFCAPPTVYRMLVLENLKEYDLSRLRHCCGAGEPLNPEVIKIWKEGTGLEIYDGYGQTETVNLLANYPCLPIKPGSMGKPTPGFDIAIIDENGQELPPEKEGLIAVKVKPEHPPGLFNGYFKNPDKTKEVFRGDWYITGDMGRKDQDGYFWFVCRADDVITSRGYRIGPFEVESALIEHKAVAEAAVIGAPDEKEYEIVKAFVVLKSGYQPSEELAKELQKHVKNVTAPYKYPKAIEFVPELPKTVSGKILRRELKKKEWAKKETRNTMGLFD